MIFGVRKGTFPYFFHASYMVLCIRAKFSDISTECENALLVSLTYIVAQSYAKKNMPPLPTWRHDFLA